MSKKIIFAILVIVIIAGFFGFWYYRDTIFSKEILKLELLGPDTAKVGDQIQYTVKYKNNGNFVLENPKLVFELPDNSLTEDGKTRLTKDLKDIYPGDEDFVQFPARLLGKEGDVKSAHVWLSYIPKNLSVRYESDTTFTTKIDLVPVTLTFDLPSKAEKGKEINYVINYFSNIDYPLENLSIKVEPTSGFDFTSSDPTSLDHAEWKLNTLQKGQGGRINIKGTIVADSQSSLPFKASLGMWQDGSFIVIKEVTQEVEVISPLLFISEQINGFANYVASPGENLHYEIFIRNIGATAFNNLFVSTSLDGQAFDFSTLTSKEGEVRKSDNTVVFDAKQVYQLQHLSSNQETKIEFDVKLKDNWDFADSQKNNVVIKNEVKVSDITQQFENKVSAKLDLSCKVYHVNQQSIQNSGPIPPEVDKTTTYAVVWQVKNDLNDVKNIKVKAVLPQGVTLSDQIIPEAEASHVSLDSQSKEIVWALGNLSGGSSALLTFQIAFTPGAFQRGNIAGLIGRASVTGEDQTTGVVVQGSALAVNTTLPDDKDNSGGGIVK